MDNYVLLDVKNLHVQFERREGLVRPLRGTNLVIRRGETLGLVGESGCGKSMLARAILGIVPEPGRITGGSITLYPSNGSNREAVELTKLHPDGDQYRHIRGNDIAIIFQEPMSSLSPVYTIGNQIIEAVMLHQDVSRKAARRRAIEMLDLVGIPDPNRRIDAYPFQLSGGMRQRIMIAMALCCEPRLLIADEPTTALDVTIQAQILELLQRLQKEFGMAILMITHNLGVVAAMAHRVAVMYLGKVVEEGNTEQIFDGPKHPYTQGLLKSVPKVGQKTKERLWAIKGNVPDPYQLTAGCAFHPRCHDTMPGICDAKEPKYLGFGNGQKAQCWLYSDDSEVKKTLDLRGADGTRGSTEEATS